MPQSPQKPLPPIGSDVTGLIPAVGADVTSLMGGQQQAQTGATDPTQGRSTASRAAGGFLTGSGIAGIPALVESLLTHPIDTVTGVAKGLVEPLGRLANVPQAYRKGGLTGAANEVAASIPILGPAAEHASQRMKSGDTAGGVGEVAGMVASPFLKVPKTLKATIGERLATTAERSSQRRMVDVIAPKVGANKVRFGNQSADVAPRLAREEGMGAATREGLADKVGGKLAESEAVLDAAHDARLSGRAYLTKGIIEDLNDRRARLTAQPIEGSRMVPEVGPTGARSGRAIGEEVVPGPMAGRVAQIDRAIAELEQLGPMVNYDAIRSIRQAYDGPAKAIYSPSMTADYMAKQGDKLGAADVTGVLRERLAQFDKGTAAANSQYSFWRKVDDVLQAAEETERVRPARGRGIAARATGALGGAVIGRDLWSMAAGVLVAEGAERLAQSGMTTKIAASRALAKLSDAMKKGDAPAVKSNLTLIARYAGLSARLAALVNERKDDQ